jgi:hypothetical protein
MIKHRQIQKRFRTLRRNRLYAHTRQVKEEVAIINLAANLNLCERMMNNYFGERRELE